jgi:hypothetical protein
MARPNQCLHLSCKERIKIFLMSFLKFLDPRLSKLSQLDQIFTFTEMYIFPPLALNLKSIYDNINKTCFICAVHVYY